MCRIDFSPRSDPGFLPSVREGSARAVGRERHRKSVSASSTFWLRFDEIRLLIIPWSQVRVLAGPPSPLEFINLWRREQGIRVPWCEPLGGHSARWTPGGRVGTDTPLAAGAYPTRRGSGLPLTTPLGAPPRRLPRERSALLISRLSALNYCVVVRSAIQSTCHQTHNYLHARLYLITNKPRDILA